MTTSTPPAAKGVTEAPISPLLRDTGDPEWKQINALFLKNGINAFPIRLRDELSNMLAWARYGEALASLSLPAPEACSECGGTGRENKPWQNGENCLTCNGSGYIPTPAAPELAVKVKPLEWRVFCSNSGNSEAKTVLGNYVIQHEDDLCMLYLPHEDTSHGKGYDTLETAKAAAQAHYEARILSALAAKDAALSERDATIARLEKKVAAFRNDGLVQAALARQGSLQDERDEAVEALSEMRAELERVKTYAHEATRTLTDLVGGGSECFAGRIGEMYIADLPYCKRRIRERESRAHEQLLKAVAAARALAPSIQDETDLGVGG